MKLYEISTIIYARVFRQMTNAHEDPHVAAWYVWEYRSSKYHRDLLQGYRAILSAHRSGSKR